MPHLKDLNTNGCVLKPSHVNRFSFSQKMTQTLSTLSSPDVSCVIDDEGALV